MKKCHIPAKLAQFITNIVLYIVGTLIVLQQYATNINNLIMKIVSLNVKGIEQYIAVDKIVRFYAYEDELVIYLMDNTKITTTELTVNEFINLLKEAN